MTVVQNQITDVEGTGTSGWVTVRLVGPGLRPATQSEILVEQTVQSDVDGQWELNLSPNTSEAPYYVVSEQALDHRAVQHVIHVLDSDTPVWLGDITVQIPLPVSPSDAVYVGPPGPPGPEGPQGPAGYTTAQVYDAVVAMLEAGTNVTLTPDPGAGTIVITAAGGSGGSSPTYANVPAGAVFLLQRPGGSGAWPSRPTTRTDISFWWDGINPPPDKADPPSTGGMYDGIDKFLAQ